MSANLSRKPRLLIVSDTAMFQDETVNFAFGPVVREVEYIASDFDCITWIGFDRKENIQNKSFLRISNPSIKLIRLKPTGGDSLKDKLEVILNTPKMLKIIFKEFKKHDIIHTRAPSSPAFLAVLISYFFKKKKIYWNKYAGNWNQKKPPFFYGLQRFILKKAFFSHVTINGRWVGQPQHCLSFENPCITEQERMNGATALRAKTYHPPFHFCFIGRIEEEKGVGRILDALEQFPDKALVHTVHFIGDGPQKGHFETRAAAIQGINILFHGYLSREEIDPILSTCQFLLLPSTASEGFPKVIAEGWNYGCIPIVSNVSSIPQYVNSRNGFVWEAMNGESFSAFFTALSFDEVKLGTLAKAGYQSANTFTFGKYRERINQEILKSKPTVPA